MAAEQNRPASPQKAPDPANSYASWLARQDERDVQG